MKFDVKECLGLMSFSVEAESETEAKDKAKALFSEIQHTLAEDFSVDLRSGGISIGITCPRQEYNHVAEAVKRHTFN